MRPEPIAAALRQEHSGFPSTLLPGAIRHGTGLLIRVHQPLAGSVVPPAPSGSAMLDSLIAVFLVIATGWLLKVRNIVSPAHWVGVERLTYQVLFPAVVIHTLAMADLRGVPVLAMGSSLVLAILSVAALLLLTRPVLARAGIDGPA